MKKKRGCLPKIKKKISGRKKCEKASSFYKHHFCFTRTFNSTEINNVYEKENRTAKNIERDKPNEPNVYNKISLVILLCGFKNQQTKDCDE